jgi:hypothetical protein
VGFLTILLGMFFLTGGETRLLDGVKSRRNGVPLGNRPSFSGDLETSEVFIVASASGRIRNA